MARWNTHPGYVAAVANRVRIGLEQFAPEDRDKVVIMFSAHSVPMTVVYKGDPYTKEIASTAERVMEKLGLKKNTHILSWQSKGTSVALIMRHLELFELTDLWLAQSAICRGWAPARAT